MPKRVVPVRRCVNVRLPLEANTASADFELVNDWVNLNESDGQTHQRSLIRLVRASRGVAES
jgi:hypothetical protein